MGSKADCNLVFICIFKLVRLWTVAKQWQGIFIIICVVGWGEGRQGMALPHNFNGRKHTIQHLRSPDLIWCPGPLGPCGPWQLPPNHSWIFWFASVLLLWGQLHPALFSPLYSPTHMGFFFMLPECHYISFCSLSLWLNSAPLCTNIHSVCVNSMMCLLKITDVDRALHSLQTTFPSIIANESHTILLGEPG